MNDNKILSFLTSSQVKVFPYSEILPDIKGVSMLCNESVSFTLAFKAKGCVPISVRACCDGIETDVFKVCYVPVTYTDSGFDEVAAEKCGLGLYPDLLLKRNPAPQIVGINDPRLPFYEKNEQNLLNATDTFNSVLITLNKKGCDLPVGVHMLTVEVTSLLCGAVVAKHEVTVNVIDQRLPENPVMYTNWMHYDCIADIHSVPLYSDEYFEILEKYLKNAVLHNMNTLLLPAFTPPLDTHTGGARKNVQLVKVKTGAEGYEFDFTLLKRFVSLALSCGIKYFEHSHLFSQWGAAGAPHIYAEENEHCIFDSKSDVSGEYSKFLQAYIPQFINAAKELGIENNMFFHISDEPSAGNIETYGRAVGIVENLLKDYNSGDALSDPMFYRNGFVKTPVVSIDMADCFFGKCHSMWLYYTGGYYPGHSLEKCSNRLLTTKPYRTRILGLHLYRYKAEGFLHWGYNYYYDRMSMGLTDPKTNACGYKNMPGGAYLAYPGTKDVHPSLREVYMSEAINDLRALTLLERYIGYDRVLKLCEDYFGKPIDCFTIPISDTHMLGFREMINARIEKL